MFLAKAQRHAKTRKEREERTRCLKGLAQVWDWPLLSSGIPVHAVGAERLKPPGAALPAKAASGAHRNSHRQRIK
jgi:hypothetical protein